MPPHCVTDNVPWPSRPTDTIGDTKRCCMARGTAHRDRMSRMSGAVENSASVKTLGPQEIIWRACSNAVIVQY